MFGLQPHPTWMNEKLEARPAMYIPMVYETVAPELARWEYRVLTVDTREAPAPGAEQLNELGRQGWALVGLLDERMGGKGGLLHYYFIRRVQA